MGNIRLLMTKTHTGNKLLYVGGQNEAEQTDEPREKQPGQMCEH